MAEDARSPATDASRASTSHNGQQLASHNESHIQTPSSSFEVKNLCQINFEDITLVEKVGHGSYGVVYKAWLNDRFVAVKEFGPTAEQKVIETEIKQLSRVKHDNIIALYGRAFYQTFEYLIMEYAEGGSLHNFLHGQVKPYYSTAHAISWARQCAEGVAYLHAMKPKPMIHRDLKPLNLLLTNKGRHLKICDFGTVADKSTLMTNNRGSAAWMAPEVFEGNNYTEKCDIFSWAIVLWEVLSRQIPFKEIDNTYSIMWKIHKGVRPPLIKDCPEPIENLMISCWATKPDDRPSMQNVAVVMRALASVFTNADIPLDYEYVDQQIISSNEDQFIDESKVSSLDFSSFHTLNINDTSTTAESVTPTNLNNLLQLTPNTQPIAAITSTRWDVIPEESELSYSTVPTDAGVSFNVLPTALAARRYEKIRNGMQQMASVPMPPLSVDVDPNAWNLSNTVGSTNLPKTNGKERLTVTESSPLSMHDSRTEAEAILTDDDSLTQLLDPELQPVRPIPGNAQSEAIYREHQQLGREHLRVMTELVYAQDFKERILEQMDPDERKQKEDLLKKMSEKEELLGLYNNLKLQLEKLRAEQAANVVPGPSQPTSQNPNANAIQQQNYNNSNSTDQTSPQQEVVAEDGWIVVSSPQNS